MRYQVLFLAELTDTACLGEPEYDWTLEAAVARARSLVGYAQRIGACGYCVLDGDQAAKVVHLEAYEMPCASVAS